MFKKDEKLRWVLKDVDFFNERQNDEMDLNFPKRSNHLSGFQRVFIKRLDEPELCKNSSETKSDLFLE